MEKAGLGGLGCAKFGGDLAAPQHVDAARSLQKIRQPVTDQHDSGAGFRQAANEFEKGLSGSDGKSGGGLMLMH